MENIDLGLSIKAEPLDDDLKQNLNLQHPAVKEETPIEIKREPAIEIHWSSPLESIEHRNCNVSGSAPNYPYKIANNFVIYELNPDSHSSPSVAGSTTTLEETFYKSSPRKLLNKKVRKRSLESQNIDNSVSLKDRKILPPFPESIPKAEIKVKCFCSLGVAPNEKNTDLSTNSHNQSLKGFFEAMFNETRSLPKQQQREVKMELLDAISQAEEDYESGKNCEKCIKHI